MVSSNVPLAVALLAGAALVAAQDGHAPTAVHSAVAAADRPGAADRVGPGAPMTERSADDWLLTGDRCLACHKGVSTSTGVDVSIGYEWRASMMANSGRDPYWQAAVRRELLDHPDAAAAIEEKCSRCHMPLASELALADGRTPSVFVHLDPARALEPDAALAADGVSCAVCHRIEAAGLGSEESYTGGFTIARGGTADGPLAYGPFEPDTGGVGIMRSATGLRPTEGAHVQSSELCASCHTLFTHAVRPDGEGPEFSEQVPYLEWQASAYAAEETSCQDCHMPVVAEEVPVTGVLGRARPDVSRHVFRGGNFFMLRVLNRYRGELGVKALPHELELAAQRSEEHLREATATVSIASLDQSAGRLEAEIVVANLAGHRFPTAYPSRRAWLRVTARDASGRTLFESGRFSTDGRIVGNDNDEDPARYEPHYETIERADQVQIYEAIMADRAGAVTTGLMSAEGWAKDNRLLPRGFDAASAGPRVSVIGAEGDPDFGPNGDRVRYTIDLGSTTGAVTLTAELWFQPIAYRWADNLSDYRSAETDRFVGYYRENAAGSAIVVGSATVVSDG
jgi:hypothetical protein